MEGPVGRCGLEATLDMIGGKWKPIILWRLRLSDGSLRFGELRRLAAGVSEKVLAQQLREMARDGLVSRHDFGEVPPRVEYTLTDLGVSLSEALRPLCEWGRVHGEAMAAASASEAG